MSINYSILNIFDETMFDSYHVSVAFVFIAPFLRHAAIFVAQFSLHNFLLQVFFSTESYVLTFHSEDSV